MKKITVLLMLFVLGLLLCPAALIFAEDVPGDDGPVPELFDGTAQTLVLDIGAVSTTNLVADPNTEPVE